MNEKRSLRGDVFMGVSYEFKMEWASWQVEKLSNGFDIQWSDHDDESVMLMNEVLNESNVNSCENFSSESSDD